MTEVRKGRAGSAVAVGDSQPPEHAALPDPRPPARVVDIDALRRFRLEHLGEPCDNECGRFGQHVHHKVFRSQGGGDVPENLAWLCHICHSAEHGIRVVP